MNDLLRSATLLLFALLAVGAYAHERQAAVTRVQLNERSGNLEVMHRFLVHDLEHASGKLFGDSADVLSNASDRQRFEDYVHGQFSLADQNGEDIALTPLGHEIDGRYLWVYAEAPMPKALTGVIVFQGALHEALPTQSNLVNVALGGNVRSATFRRGSPPATIDLSR